MSEQTHETPAPKPGKVLVEAETTGDKCEGDVGLHTRCRNGQACITWADPATVHPASLVGDLRAERDAARRNLAEALALLTPAVIVTTTTDELAGWNRRKLAILARHAPEMNELTPAINHIGQTLAALPEQPERRKGEKDRRKAKNWEGGPWEYGRRKDHGDRRKPQPAPVDCPVCHHTPPQLQFCSACGPECAACWKARAEAAEQECERLRQVARISDNNAVKYSDFATKCQGAANARAEEAEAKLAQKGGGMPTGLTSLRKHLSLAMTHFRPSSPLRPRA